MPFQDNDAVVNQGQLITETLNIPAQTDGVIISQANGSALVEFDLPTGKVQTNVPVFLLDTPVAKLEDAELKDQKLELVFNTLTSHQTKMETTHTNAEVIAAVLFLIKVMIKLLPIVARRLT